LQPAPPMPTALSLGRALPSPMPREMMSCAIRLDYPNTRDKPFEMMEKHRKRSEHMKEK
jgi:hypothetical protein